jgi:hypothetical protein
MIFSIIIIIDCIHVIYSLPPGENPIAYDDDDDDDDNNNNNNNNNITFSTLNTAIAERRSCIIVCFK